MTIVGFAIIALRVVAAILGVWNISWSFMAIRRIASTPITPVMLYLSVVFWLSLTSIAAQVGTAFETLGLVNRDPWVLVALLFFVISLSLAAIGHRKGAAARAQQFYGLYPHLDMVLPLSDLAAVDPASARALSDEARRIYVAKAIGA